MTIITRINTESIHNYTLDVSKRLRQPGHSRNFTDLLQKNSRHAIELSQHALMKGSGMDDSIYFLQMSDGEDKGFKLVDRLEAEPLRAAMGGSVYLDMKSNCFIFLKVMCSMLKQQVPFSIDDLIENPTRWSKRVAKECIIETQNIDNETKEKFVLNAIYNLVVGGDDKCIYNTSDRYRFEQHPDVQSIFLMKKKIVNQLHKIEAVRDLAEDYPSLQTRGRVSYNKVLNFLADEHHVMLQSYVEAILEDHDVYTFWKTDEGMFVDADFKHLGVHHSLMKDLKTISNIDWKITAEYIKPYYNENSRSSVAVEEDLKAHKDRLEAEEQLSQIRKSMLKNKTDK